MVSVVTREPEYECLYCEILKCISMPVHWNSTQISIMLWDKQRSVELGILIVVLRCLEC